MKKQENEFPLKESLLKEESEEERTQKMSERIKAFCKIAYQLYLKSNNPDTPTIASQLESEPPDEFTNAA